MKSSTIWNAGRAVGERIPFSASEAQSIFDLLRERKSLRDLSLFVLGVDTMLRASDLLQLRVSDIQDKSGKLRSKLVLRQQKTRYPVYPVLTTTTKLVLIQWLNQDGKSGDEYLFTPRGGTKPISSGWYRRLVKCWVAGIGLVPDNYSTHSLRRTKPIYLYYQKNVDIQHIAMLLGHNNVQTTSRYLRLELSEAQSVAMAAYPAPSFKSP